MEVNRIYHEDCLVTMSRMEDNSVDLTLTDFPYGIDENYDIYKDTSENLNTLIQATMPEILRVSKRVALTCGVKNMYLFPKPSWVLNWCTPSGNGRGPWGFCTWQPILVYGNDPYLSNRKGSRPDSFLHIENSVKNGHPCPKPIRIWRKILLRCSCNESDMVYDPFLGSGTTAVSCIKENRNWIASEISAEYVEIAEKRIKIEQSKLTFQF